ncbi:MAG: GNAT family N-acetyltransferase [Salinibacterium sp.]|nr:GNAT family N-acetyltransferase [Salinibacterium sp.]
MKISLADPADERVRPILEQHLAEMHATSPPESVHALDIDELRHSDVSFYVGEEDGDVLVCGALKRLGSGDGELKSMRTIEQARGRGLASLMLEHLLDVARSRGYPSIRLETGAEDYFAAARRLYARHGFVEGEPFAHYTFDANSVYMHLDLRD